MNQTCSGITQGQSTFYVNNPEIAPPLADSVATDIDQATVSVDLLGLGGVKQEEELIPGFPSTPGNRCHILIKIKNRPCQLGF